MKTDFKYALFYDFHTGFDYPCVGRDFDVEKFTDQLVRCKVDFLTWHARCNQGGAYYDTQCGLKHPGLSYDLFGRLAEACKRKNIRLSAYFNAGLSDEELLRHPEWAAVSPAGLALRENHDSPFVRSVCYNSGFTEHLVKMALEVLERYPVDGFFFDCMKVYPCICPNCVRRMAEEGVDRSDPEALRQFNSRSYARLGKRLAEAIRAVKPDALLVFNCDDKELLAGEHSHFECECLPTGNWGYDYLPLYSRYNRALAGPGRQVLNMTGRFYQWGDFGGLRPEAALEYDMFYGAALGLRPDIGGHFHPRGDLDLPVFDRIAEVYGKLQAFDSFTEGAVTSNDIALVFDKADPAAGKAGARMLDELKIQFNAVTEFCDWTPYRLLILADGLVLGEKGLRQLHDHLRNGGKVLAFGKAALHNGAFPDEFPVEYLGALSFSPVYFLPEGPLASGLPGMPLSLYADAVKVRVKPGADAAMRLVRSWRNRGWDGLRSNFYTPPEETVEDPFLVCSGNVIYCSGNLMSGYWRRAPYQHRLLLAALLEHLCGKPRLVLRNFPVSGRAFLQQKPDSELVHLLAYAPEVRGLCTALEDRITVCDAGLDCQVAPGRPVKAVRLAPGGQALDFEQHGDRVTFMLPRMDGYALIEIAYGAGN